MKMEDKKWTHIRVSVEVRHALKVYAACHNITMSNAIIDLIRKVEAVKPQEQADHSEVLRENQPH